MLYGWSENKTQITLGYGYMGWYVTVTLEVEEGASIVVNCPSQLRKWEVFTVI